MSTYEPGTVAIATVRGVPNVRIFRYHERNWISAESVGESRLHSNEQVTDIHPLVVLDLGEFDPEVTAKHLRRMGAGCVCSEIADQIEAQTKPPRIPEPTMYGVVKANIGDGGPWTLTRTEYGWVCLDDGAVWAWESLIDPTLIRDGIEATS